MKNKLTMPENVFFPERKRKRRNQALEWYRKRPFLYTFLLLVLLHVLLGISLEVYTLAGGSEESKKNIAKYITCFYPSFATLISAFAFNTYAGTSKEKANTAVYWLCKLLAVILFILAVMGLQGAVLICP